MNMLLGGWEIGTRVTYHSGLPFSVVDSNNPGLGNFSGSLLAVPTGKPVQTGSCGEASVNTPCLSSNAFVDASAASFTAYSGFSPQTRNQFRAGGFFDMDLSVFRTFPIMEKAKFALGMSAFNFLNHPNFGIPDNGFGDGTYGQVTGMVNPPTSPYGNFLGFDSSVRVIQLSGKLTF